MEELAPLSAHKAAGELNRRGIKSATGGVWYPATVLRLRERLAWIAGQPRIGNAMRAVAALALA
jgi:hypothetical protein